MARIVLPALAVLTGGMALFGAVDGHNGIFEMGMILMSVCIGATIGFLAAAR